MSATDESPSHSGRERHRGARMRPLVRDGWREFNAPQLVCIAGGTVAGMFGLFGGVLTVLSVWIGVQGGLAPSVLRAALIPSVVAIVGAGGAVAFTRSAAIRRAAWQHASPALLMGLAGLLAALVSWLVAG